jgi:alpha-galactosidase
MGWNSWNHFSCNIDEKMIKETADALVTTGLSKLGYNYVNIDDCWAEISRDSKGSLVPKKSTFPSGIKAVADYVHSKGLKLGIYSDAG